MLNFPGSELEALIKDTLSGVCVLDASLRYVAVSQRWCHDFHLKGSELVGKHHYTVFPDLPSRWKVICAQALSGQTKLCELERFVRASGEVVWLSWLVRPWHLDDGSVGGIIIFSEVHNQQKLLKTQLEQSEQRHQYAVTAGGVGVWDWDVATDYLIWNSVMHALFNVPEEDFQHTFNDFIQTVHPDDVEQVNSSVNKIILGQQGEESTYRIVLKNGDVRYIYAKSHMNHQIRDHSIRMTGICYDITQSTVAQIKLSEALKEQRAAQKELEAIAFYDSVTQLPNRRHYSKYLEGILSAKQPPEALVAVLLLDIDNFKTVNDTMGHDVGDQLLALVAQAFRSALREEEFLARLGGDEFVVVIDDVKNKSQLYMVAKRLSRSLLNPFHLSGREVMATVSIGLTFEPAKTTSAEQLLRQADLAMYHAKEEKSGIVNARFYTEQLKLDNQARFQLEQALRSAVDNDEFFLVFQPQVNLSTQQLFGLEVLVRWRHPSLGDVSPSVFIPIAEHIGVINAIGSWVLKTAAREYAQWISLGVISKKVKLSVNFSPSQFLGGQIPVLIGRLCTQYGIAANTFIVELTETAITKNFEALKRHLQALVARGVGIAIDDFGTGYSSLSYISQLPIRYLKIDQSFLCSIPENKNNMAIIKAVMEMASALKLRVIAEGVEDSDQLAFLRSIHCIFGQGNTLSEPLMADEVASYLCA